ncbi:DUF4189 domain-containing protein [Variovorax sp.]|uniref:DUF4189 domain-containing protein n=1 Tax=Variovorax sp. TaxID=1871043 RepID=UPI002D7522F5|nr:DUF4189 domain-containing protein [Variovorax sp.]HYP83370.1 DUF4189 domain-containing protein [Variovorax sp.]
MAQSDAIMMNDAPMTFAAHLLSCTLALLAVAAPPSAAAATAPAWGAIAATRDGFGYAYSHSTRGAAETAAREQCEQAVAKSRPGSARGTCEVRTAFDHSCGAMAVGNFGEWGIATAATETAARQAAVQQCNTHLPTEPCKVTVGFCSLK